MHIIIPMRTHMVNVLEVLAQGYLALVTLAAVESFTSFSSMPCAGWGARLQSSAVPASFQSWQVSSILHFYTPCKCSPTHKQLVAFSIVQVLDKTACRLDVERTSL